MFRLILGIVIFTLLSVTQGFNLCGEWTQFGDNKCVKVLENQVKEEDAVKNCTNLDKNSILVTINDMEEQDFLSKLLSKYDNISQSVWLGMKRTGSSGNASYEWTDHSSNAFSFWSQESNSTDERSQECVRMSLGKSNLGRWTDDGCKKLALVICQKKKQVDLKILTETIDTLEKHYKKLADESNGMIPMGFIYTQLPYQTSAPELWPTMNWADVTKDYAGLFFRAEGNGTAEFGQIQQPDQTRIADIRARSLQLNNNNPNNPVDYPLKKGEITDIHPGGVLYQLKINVTSAENRPINTAVRIWKRIENPGH